MSDYRELPVLAIVYKCPRFYLESRNFIQKIIEDSDLLDGMDCLKDFVCLFRYYLKCRVTWEHFLDVIFCIIEQFQIADEDVIRNSSEHFFARKFTAFCEECEDSHFPSPFERVPDPCQHVKPRPGSFYSYFNQITSFENFEVMKILLRYGQHIDFEEKDVKRMVYLFSLDILYPPGHERLTDLNFNRSKWFCVFNDCRASAAGARRMLLIALAVRFLDLKIWNDVGVLPLERYRTEDGRIRYVVSQDLPHVGFAESLKLLFNTIKDPLLTVYEIASLFEAVIEGPSKVQKINELCSMIVKEFPTSADPLQPRSLKHLSRCCVRDCLSSSHRLPFGVSNLPLPPSLKDYVLIQNKKDDFYPRLLLTELQHLQELNRIE